MIKRCFFALAAGGLLAACQPAIPDSGFAAEQRARDAALAGQPVLPPAEVSAVPLDAAQPAPVQTADASAAATAAETARVLAATRPGVNNGVGNDAATNSGQAPVNASPANPAPPLVNTAGISSENNFDAVSGQRTIDDDAARLAANRAQYQVVQPEALPERVDGGPNIVAYALSTSHAPGTQIYRRISLNREARFRRACAAYASPDQAQIDFLSKGGPERDRRGVDPDGDGFACTWDPRPFRLAAQG